MNHCILCLSTSNCVSKNSTTLIDCLSHQQSNASIASTSLDVVVTIDDFKRQTFLEHAHHLYRAALEFSSQVCVTVIPSFPMSVTSTTTQPGSSSPFLQPLRDCGLSQQELLAHEAEFGVLYQQVAVGGTFDRLHAGHKLLLSYAALYARERLRVGIAADRLLANKKFKELLEPFEIRQERVTAFLRCLRVDLLSEVVPITDVYGGTNTIAELEAIILSPETEKALGTINGARTANGLSPLIGVTIPNVCRPNGPLITSTELRQTEAEREGGCGRPNNHSSKASGSSCC